MKKIIENVSQTLMPMLPVALIGIIFLLIYLVYDTAKKTLDKYFPPPANSSNIDDPNSAFINSRVDQFANALEGLHPTEDKTLAALKGLSKEQFQKVHKIYGVRFDVHHMESYNLIEMIKHRLDLDNTTYGIQIRTILKHWQLL